MVDHPVFPFPNPKAYVETMSRKGIPLIGDVVVVAHLALLEPKELEIIKAIKAKHVASLLEINYWSGSPYWLGPATGGGRSRGKVLSRFAPGRPHSSTRPPRRSANDYLTQALASYLQSQEAVFDFKVQLQTGRDQDAGGRSLCLMG